MGMLQIAGQIKLAFGVSIHKDVFLPRVSHYHLERNHQGLDNRLMKKFIRMHSIFIQSL